MPKKPLNLKKREVTVSNPSYTMVRKVIVYANDEGVIRFLLSHQIKEVVEDIPTMKFSAN